MTIIVMWWDPWAWINGKRIQRFHCETIYVGY